MNGWVKIWRKISADPLWTAEKFTRGQAWIDLIMLTNHKDGHIRVRGIKVPVKRGECGWSVLRLAERWRWSRGKVQRFLDELETDQQIVQQKNRVTSIIQIVNYNNYQANGTTDRSTGGQQTDTNKNDKKITTAFSNAVGVDGVDYLMTKKGRRLNGKRFQSFNTFWDAFGYKKGKREAADAWYDIPELTDNLVEQIIDAAKQEADHRPELMASGKTAKMAQGWISGRRWEDEEYVPKEPELFPRNREAVC